MGLKNTVKDKSEKFGNWQRFFISAGTLPSHTDNQQFPGTLAATSVKLPKFQSKEYKTK